MDPKFHQIDRFLGAGRSTRELFITLNKGCVFRAGLNIYYTGIRCNEGGMGPPFGEFQIPPKKGAVFSACKLGRFNRASGGGTVLSTSGAETGAKPRGVRWGCVSPQLFEHSWWALSLFRLKNRCLGRLARSRGWHEALRSIYI